MVRHPFEPDPPTKEAMRILSEAEYRPLTDADRRRLEQLELQATLEDRDLYWGDVWEAFTAAYRSK